jgi:L-aminopeptidase/D-esterase-like protein
MRARDLGLACGSLPPGQRNSLADVSGIIVGHSTLIEGDVRTGVTAILPHDGDLFRDNRPCDVPGPSRRVAGAKIALGGSHLPPRPAVVPPRAFLS